MTGGRVYLRARITPPTVRNYEPHAVMQCEGEDCPCASGHRVHPPAIMMKFDPESGSYQQARVLCVAYWAEETRSPAAGEICGRPATHQVADVVVCEHHYRRIRGWMNDRDQRDVISATETASAIRWNQMRLDRERAAEQARLRAEAAEEEARLRAEAARAEAARIREAGRLAAEMERERVLAEEAARAALSVVYFAWRESDGLIKIGTTRTLAKRMVTLKKENGPLRLIATVGGSHQQETALHRKFKALRAEGEWFRPELPLLEHVYALMKQRPIEAAPGLPPIMERKEIGKLIWRIRYKPTYERQRQARAARDKANAKRRLARQRRQSEAAA